MSQQPAIDFYAYKDYEKQFMGIILDRLGLTLENKDKNVSQLLCSACKKWECTPAEYLNRLASSPDNAPILRDLITEITVGESYFFRDKNQMQFLQQLLLPKIIQRKREAKNLTLRIWSAGCSTGEEIYTIAMLLYELLPDIDQWDLHLLGTDINTESLQQVKLAIYKKWSMRTISTYHSQHYLSKENDHFALSPKIKACVTFLYLNLNDNSYPSILNGTHSQDLILCRNVFIYFNKKSIAAVMKKLSKCLGQDGYIILGASDPVTIEDTDLIFHHRDGLVFSRETPDLKAKSIEKSIKKPFLPLKTSVKPKEPIPDANPALTLYNKAKGLADTGLLDKAISLCEQSIQLNPTSKDSYFLYGLILMEGNQWKEAEKALRQCLFLDRKFVEGHFQLGLLLLKNKYYADGLKSLDNALKIVETHPPQDIVPQSQGLNFGRFGEIIRTEIAAYSSAKEPKP